MPLAGGDRFGTQFGFCLMPELVHAFLNPGDVFLKLLRWYAGGNVNGRAGKKKDFGKGFRND